jgi:hypothetical protein
LENPRGASLKEFGQGYVEGIPMPQSDVWGCEQFGWQYMYVHCHAVIKQLWKQCSTTAYNCWPHLFTQHHTIIGTIDCWVLVIMFWFWPMPHKWVPLTTEWPVLRLRVEEWPPIWRIAVTIFNKQSRTSSMVWSSSLGVEW